MVDYESESDYEGDEGDEESFNDVDKVIDGISQMVEFVVETKQNKNVIEELLTEITFIWLIKDV